MEKKYELDRYAAVYAMRTGSMVSSEVRDLLSVTERPDIISLAGGLPYTRGMDGDMLARLFAEIMRDECAEALQYGTTDGLGRLKDQLACVMAAEGLEVHPEEIIITHGSQQGLELLSKIFINPGDVILTEAPSYVGALNSFVSYQPRMEGIPLDDHGLDTDLLKLRLEALAAAGERPKFLYVIPNFQNPAGVTMGLDRRKALMELAREHELLLVEDNPYGLLRFEGEPLPTLKSFDPDRVVYLGTLSKILSAGMRLGWFVAPPPVTEKLLLAKQSADLCTSPLTQRLAQAYFSTQDWRAVINKLVDVYRARRDAMLAALEEFFPEGTSWTHPEGGFFVWAKLPEYVNTKDMLATAIDQKVAYVPGAAFFPDRSGGNHMRLNFSYPPEEQIWEGVRRLSLVIKRELRLARSLGLAGPAAPPADAERTEE